MQKQRTSQTWVVGGFALILGIINVFSGQGELGWSQDNISAITGHSTPLLPGDVAPAIPSLFSNLPAYQGVSFVSWVWIIAGVTLFIAAFGLLNVKQWGMTLGLISVVAFLLGWLYVFFQILSETAEAPAAMFTVFMNITMFILLRAKVVREQFSSD